MNRKEFIVDIKDRFSELLIGIKKVTTLKLQRKITEDLYDSHGVPRGLFQEFLIHPERFFNKEELLKIFILYIYNVTRLESLNPELFFEDAKQTLNYKYPIEKNDEDIVLNQVLRSSDQDYLTIISYQKLVELWLTGQITYNYLTQRKPKQKLVVGKIVESPQLNRKSVLNIVRLMKEKKFKCSSIVLNVVLDKSQIEYTEDGDLIIKKNSEINLIDGMHRLQAMVQVCEEDPDYEGYMDVAIKYYSLSDAQYLIGLLNTVNRFDKTLVRHNTDENESSKIVKMLLSHNEFKNKISLHSHVDKKLNYITNYTNFTDSIQEVFAPKTVQDRYLIFDICVKFFEYLFSYYAEEFQTNVFSVSQRSWINHHHVFTLYIQLLHDLYKKSGKNFPVSEIVEFINKIDFQKDAGGPIDLIMREQNKINLVLLRKKIRKIINGG